MRNITLSRHASTIGGHDMHPFRAASILLLVTTMLFSVNSPRALSQAVEDEPLIPQNLLKLMHTPEVQRELGVEDDARLLKILRELILPGGRLAFCPKPNRSRPRESLRNGCLKD
jgi:hypothetical protein